MSIRKSGENIVIKQKYKRKSEKNESDGFLNQIVMEDGGESRNNKAAAFNGIWPQNTLC